MNGVLRHFQHYFSLIMATDHNISVLSFSLGLQSVLSKNTGMKNPVDRVKLCLHEGQKLH